MFDGLAWVPGDGWREIGVSRTRSRVLGAPARPFPGSRDRGGGGAVLLGCVGVVAGAQPLPAAAVSVLSLWNAASSSVAQGQVFWRWSLARRPENARRPATCSSW